jgi:hypothetical protein
MSKNNVLKGTALSQMYCIVANDWTSITIGHQFKNHPELQLLVKNTQALAEIAVEDNMKALYETLKQYYQEEDVKSA